MAYTLWSQDIFTKGELSPFMYARCTVNEYQNGLKTAQNVLTYPTGAAGKRFGTLYNATIPGVTSGSEINFQTFQYLNECVYQLVITIGNIYIYLEGILVATVSNNYTINQIANLSTTVLNQFFRISTSDIQPQDLKRVANSGITINGFTTTSYTTSSAGFVANTVYPVQFTVSGGTIMQTVPQISPNVTYFVAATSTTTGTLFSNSRDAKRFLQNRATDTPVITISGLGTGTTTSIVQNTWSLSNVFFKNVPFYDFNGSTTSYDGCTFTPNATSGADVVITVSPAYAPLNSSYVGGVFIGGGGTARITVVNSTTQFRVATQIPFTTASVAIQGSLALLAEPAWSTTRGYPQVCSSYQSRALFANSKSLPNGFWASVTNDYSDFSDLSKDDDDAISRYPTSDNMNYIKFIVPYRSVTVHTNTGIYSSPLSDISAITPSNFALLLQDSTPATVLQPQAVDNQILVLSGNDAHQMIWDGINNAYTSNIVSAINEQTIRNPIDETAFIDLSRAGSRFVFIVNANGSMAIFQTLISQNVAGFTPHIMEQSYGNASFRQVASSIDGRCWFIIERQIANPLSAIPISLTGLPTTTVAATASNFDLLLPTAVEFTTSGSLPTSIPQITTNKFFWVIGIDADHFKVYVAQQDALAGINAISFTTTGSSSSVVPNPLTTIFTMEELTYDTYLDCAVYYSGSPESTITTGPLFNAQDIKMVGDGFGFDSAGEVNVNNEVIFKAHGTPVPVIEAFIGFPINLIIEPMPLSISLGNSVKSSSLTRPIHTRFVNFMFSQTIGGQINGVPIALAPFDMAHIGEPPQPASGIFEISTYSAWDDFNNPVFTLTHNDPFNIILLGVFYAVETS